MQFFETASLLDAQDSMWMVAISTLLAVIADILITSVLIVSLRRSRTGFKRTDSRIEVVVMYSVNTGLVTGILHIFFMVFSLSRELCFPLHLGSFARSVRITQRFAPVASLKHSNIHLRVAYAIALLVTLNSREPIATKGEDAGHTYHSDIAGFPGCSFTRSASGARNARQIETRDGTSAIELGMIKESRLGTEEAASDSIIAADHSSRIGGA
ncbi:hypothetical protein GY45DRAFT_114456 [Cubamyces sp. BRFM 1775]|nr:hypothetical protein GY45DRAFT_114456 [Cubamyces sp. BRFM 1775]